MMDQICSLAWSKNVNELVSTHGYSQNQIVVWRYPSMSKVATLTGHNLRVLYLVRACSRSRVDLDLFELEGVGESVICGCMN